MAKPFGSTCNLDCAYCYYLEKRELYPETRDFRMSEETLEAFVRQYIAAHPGPVVQFAWQGGEPTLLGLDFFRRVVQLQRRYAPPEKTVTNALQTNGTMLDDVWCTFLREHGFLVGISIDGPAFLHDRYRVTTDDSGTLERVLAGHDLLREHDVQHNVLCVVNRLNSQYPLEVYQFLRDRGVEWLQFIPLVEPIESQPQTDQPADSVPCQPGDPPGGPAVDGPGTDDHGTDDPAIDDPAGDPELPAPVEPPAYSWPSRTGKQESDHSAKRHSLGDAVTARSVEPEAYGRFLCAIFDEWVRNDIGSMSVQLFDQCIPAWFGGNAGLCVFTETCGRQVAIEHNGDLYACDHYVEPGYLLGNIHDTPIGELIESRQQRAFGRFKVEGLPSTCHSCDVRFVCHGGCPKNRIVETQSGEFGLNYLCDGYRRFFSHVDGYMPILARASRAGDSPRTVMRRIAARDRLAT